MPGGEGDEVREALDRDRVAVADELRDGVAHRGDLAGMTSRMSTPARHRRAPSTSRQARLGVARRGVGTAPRRRPPRRRSAPPSRRRDSEATSGGHRRTVCSPHSRTSRPRWKHAHLDVLGELRRGELDADHQALAADVEDRARVAARCSARRPAIACSPRAAALSMSPSSSSSIVASAAAQATGLPP